MFVYTQLYRFLSLSSREAFGFAFFIDKKLTPKFILQKIDFVLNFLQTDLKPWRKPCLTVMAHA